jgi:hypothetical protein
MYTIHLPAIGEVSLCLSTIRFDGFKIYMSGYDEDKNLIDVLMDKIVYPVSKLYDYGYCHILSYTMHGQTVPYNNYHAIH